MEEKSVVERESVGARGRRDRMGRRVRIAARRQALQIMAIDQLIDGRWLNWELKCCATDQLAAEGRREKLMMMGEESVPHTMQHRELEAERLPN